MSIGEKAFGSSDSVTITYAGTEAKWNAINKASSWCDGTTMTVVYASKE